MKKIYFRILTAVLGAGFSGITLAASRCYYDFDTHTYICPDDSSNTHEKISSEVAVHESYRQISRRTSEAITGNLASKICQANASCANSAFASANGQNPMAGSADGNSLLPDSFWTNFSWTSLTDDGLAAEFNTDIYQGTAGIDKRFGDFIFGVSLSYAYAHTGQTTAAGLDAENHIHTVDLTPYAAYIINDNFFLSAFSGYNYSNANPLLLAGESETDGYNTELSINSMHTLDSWFFKTKAGARYQHSNTKTDSLIAGGPTTRDNLDNWVILANADVGYVFSPQLRTYAGVLYEYNTNTGNSNILLATGGSGLSKAQSVFYFNAGVDYWITPAFALGAKLQTDLSNDYVDLTTVGLNARLEL